MPHALRSTRASDTDLNPHFRASCRWLVEILKKEEQINYLEIGELAIQLISLIFDNSPQGAFCVINSGAICRH